MTPSRGLAIVLVCSLLVACGRGAKREWRADDHDEEPGNPTQVAPSTGAKAAANGDDLVEATWEGACASCHGPTGRGDGPNGPMVKAPDLSTATLQDSRTDAELAAAIAGGRGKMPKFDTLPPSVVTGLVRKIRSLRAK